MAKPEDYASQEELIEICQDIIDVINTDCRQWQDPPDYLGMLEKIEQLAGGYYKG